MQKLRCFHTQIGGLRVGLFDFLGDVLRTAHRGERDDAASPFERAPEFRHGRDLVALGPHLELAQDQPVLPRPSTGAVPPACRARRRALPSRATIAALPAARRLCVQRLKHSRNDWGSSAGKRRLKVSWLGMPPGSSRKVLRHSSLARPKSSMSLKPSPPQSSVQTAMTSRSISRCSLVRATRGSGKI